MIRLSELKLPLSALPTEARRAADAPPETDDDRSPPPHPEAALRTLAAAALGVAEGDLAALHVFKRSFDARKAALRAVFTVDVALSNPQQETQLLQRHAAHPHIQPTPDMRWQPPLPLVQAPPSPPQGVDPARLRPVVIGFGPCGMLAALALAQMGLRPLVLERGRTVRQRTQDTWGLWRRHVLTPESNVQFGEGGAGTFSDGKLYSQIKDPRHLGRKVMQEFVNAGAPADILYAAHPHIGTFKLVKVVQNIRQQIEALGGQVCFEQLVTDFIFDSNKPSKHLPQPPETLAFPTPCGQRLRGLVVQDQASGQTRELRADHVILALGHSARDTFARLYERGVALQAKPFSIGFRIEHPQSLIDAARWGRHAGHPLLGAADYKLVHHASAAAGPGAGRAVYSFCMCPGGTVVAATSEPGRVVTNGMSQYSRAERNANAGIVVAIDPRDYPRDAQAFAQTLGASYGIEAFAPADAAAAHGIHGPAHGIHGPAHAPQFAPQHYHPLAGVVLQRQLESTAFTLGGGTYEAPGQRVGDFIAGRPSRQWGDVQPSYKPGVQPGDLHPALPPYAIAALREALPAFARQIQGFDRHDAVLTGVETRTSSPLRIPRGDDLQSINTPGLYPAGEGAGYAGGILSAAVDGIRVAEAVARCLSASLTNESA